jgi:predicted dehydrogenase
MAKQYKWGIIGCGDVTEIKSGPAYQKTESFSLHAVMRRNLEKAKDYADRHGVPKYYNDASLLINDPEVDAVYIATPPDSHASYALQVAEAGKICCIEKPMAPSFEECEQIVNVFAEKNIPLFVAYYRRSLPRFEKIKEWLQENKIGTVRHISWMYTRTPSPLDLSEDYNWRTDAKIAPGGYFDDLASHGMDLFVHYLGEITKVNGIAVSQNNLYTAKDAIVGNWLHESGVTGSGTWNFGADKRVDEVEIIGSEGRIVFSVFDEAAIQLKSINENISLEIEHPENVQLFHVKNMELHLLGKRNHPSTGKTAMHASWVLDKILGKL